MARSGKEIAQRRLAQAFNEWMRRYTEAPEEFAREWQSVATFLAEQAKGEAPSYGAQAAAYLASILESIPFEPGDHDEEVPACA